MGVTGGVRWSPHDHQPRVAITLLGTFGLDVDGCPVSLPTSARRLVGILALRGRLGRSRLAGMLWSDTTEQRALASLRTGIWRVNQAARGLVVSEHGSVSLGLSPEIDLHQLMAHGHAVLADSATALADQRHLMIGCGRGLDPGELLPDWDDAWLEQERERLRQLLLHVMEAEARWYSCEGRFGLALDLALALLHADELRESAHRLVVEIHLAEGNFAQAQRAYERCRTVLGAELGVAPSTALRGLVESAAAKSTLLPA
jgi:DNA-binding SARP family transcriptional activator